MRVLFVTHNVPRFDGDAAGSFVLRLAVALQQAGARVEIVAPGARGLGDRTVLEGVTIHRVRYASDERMTLAYEGTMVEQVLRSWSARFALLGLLRALRQGASSAIADAHRAGDPFDVVHAHWWFPAGLALWRAGTRSWPARVVTMHGSDVRLAKSVAPARGLMRSVLAGFELRTAVSSWLAANVARIAPQSPVRVAPMPVDTRHFSLPSQANRAGILFVGRLNEQKGIADLLHALSKPVLSDAMLDVVGDGPDRTALEMQAQRVGVSSRIRWHGALTQASLVPMYQRTAVVAMPSREEGLGLVAVEAQLCGAPVVAYASGGLPDVVSPEAGGALVQAGDIDALASALASLAANAEESERRGRSAHDTVLARFSPEAVARTYLALYEQVIAQKRGVSGGAR